MLLKAPILLVIWTFASSFLIVDAFVASIRRYNYQYFYMSADKNAVPSLLTFQDPSTGILVKIVGSMHYNPASIRLAESTVEELALKNELSSVIVESCPKRWEKMKLMQRDGSLLKDILRNEMQAASEMAHRYGLPTVLGDQEIELTNARIIKTFKETVWILSIRNLDGRICTETYPNRSMTACLREASI